MRFALRATTALALALACRQLSAADDGYFTVDARIDLPGVGGRIDHLAYDAMGQRLFVAELGNDSVDVVDIAARRVMHHLGGLHEPQGIAWSAKLDRLYVACSDGSVQAFSGTDYSPVASAQLRSDADNLRLDDAANRLYVGYGEGAIAVLDASTLGSVGEIGLKAHPESFQLGPGAQLFVNVPGAQEVAVADTRLFRQAASWSLGESRANYPLALDAQGGRLLVVFRRPASVTSYRLKDGKVLGNTRACADADDVFVDNARQRIYVVCGDGFVDVLDSTLSRVARAPTSQGARTGLYSREADRLFVASRAVSETPAAIWILAPPAPVTAAVSPAQVRPPR